MFEFHEEKEGKKRFLVAKCLIRDTGKPPTANGNVSCGGTGGNKPAITPDGLPIMATNGKPITAGVIMYSPE